MTDLNYKPYTPEAYSGLCVGGPHDGKYLTDSKTRREVFGVTETTKDAEGRYTSATFNKLGEYVFYDRRWNWQGLQ